MGYTPTPNDALLEQAIAANTLTQLNLKCVFPKVATVNFEKGAFDKGESVKIRRPKRRRAQNADPRAGAITFNEATYFKGEVTLENIWSDGFLVYKIDPSQTASKYVKEVSEQSADAINTPNEEYLYSKFRTWALPATGVVELGAHAPIALVASVNGANYAAMDNQVARNAQLVADTANLPTSGKLSMILSSKAKSDFLGDATILGFAGMTAKAGDLISSGLRNGQFVERYGFDMTGSNVVGGQSAVASSLAGIAISAAPVLNPLFLQADAQVATPVGTLDFACAAAPAGFAVGQIAQIKKGTEIVGHGVILRIAGNAVSLTPYDNSGALMVSAQFDGTEKLSIPFIPSVSPFFHEEALLIAQRLLQEPSDRSGAKAVTQVDSETNLTMQVITGNYQIERLREVNACFMMNGAKISDYRKAGLVLTL